jgi:hypothetical protein
MNDFSHANFQSGKRSKVVCVCEKGREKIRKTKIFIDVESMRNILIDGILKLILADSVSSS